jgi:hypothetical protein
VKKKVVKTKDDRVNSRGLERIETKWEDFRTEGVVPFMNKLFIRQLYSCGKTKISATELNRRILLFHFSFYDLSNKLSTKFIDAEITKKGDYQTKQRTFQNWCLIRTFPL